MAKFIQDGKSIDYVAGTAGVAAGDIVTVGGTAGIIGVAKVDIAPGATGSLALEGVYAIPTAATFAVGAKVYWNGTAGVASSTNTAYFGKAVEASAGGEVKVILIG